jgi:hypothetical protein
MKHLKPNPLSLLAALMLLAFLSGCTNTIGAWKNEQIEPGKKAAFHRFNDEVFKCFKTADEDELKLHLSKDMIDGWRKARTMHHIQNELDNYKYVMLDEYYAVNKYNTNDTITASGKDINSYSLYYRGITQEMSMVFFVPEDKQIKNRHMISITWAKYAYGWKISNFDLKPYTINGKTAPELYKEAQEQFAKNHTVDAYNSMTYAMACIKPAEGWKYSTEKEMAAFSEKLATEMNNHYLLPLSLDQLKTKPQIFNISNQSNKEGTFPMVYYLTRINLKDTVAVKKEHAEIGKIISKLLPGIDKENKYIFYAAFNQKPNKKQDQDHFDMTDKLR